MIFRNPTSLTLEAIRDLLVRWSEGLNGRVEFGRVVDQTHGLNIEGEFLALTAHATPNTEFSVTHHLNRVPEGYLIVGRKAAGHLYDHYAGMTAWTSTTLYLKSDVASLETTIFLF